MARKPMQRNPRVADLFTFIVDYKVQHDGNSPSTAEMCAYLNTSTSVVHHYLDRLVADGDLLSTGDKGQARSLEVAGGQWTYSPGA